MLFDKEERAIVTGHLSRKDAVLRILSRAICEGRLPAGMQLNQDEIATELGVSRMPVREALKELEAQGLVTFYPYRGVEVSQLSIEDIEELFAIRASLEQLSLSRAVPNLSEQSLQEMEDVLGQMDDYLQRGSNDHREWTLLNNRFHRVINQACDWPRLIDMIDSLRGNVDRYVAMYLSLRGREEPQHQHWELYRACRDGDVAQAQGIIKRHVMETANLLIAALRQNPDNVSTPKEHKHAKGA